MRREVTCSINVSLSTAVPSLNGRCDWLRFYRTVRSGRANFPCVVEAIDFPRQNPLRSRTVNSPRTCAFPLRIVSPMLQPVIKAPNPCKRLKRMQEIKERNLPETMGTQNASSPLIPSMKPFHRRPISPSLSNRLSSGILIPSPSTTPLHRLPLRHHMR